MENNLFIKNNYEKIIRGNYSEFLDPSEQKSLISLLNKNNIKYNIYEPFKDATKTIIYTKEFPKVSLLEIKAKNQLKHSDILGSLFSHNIALSKYGDIIICDKYYVIVLDSIKNYLLTNLTKVGKTNVSLLEVSSDLINDYQYEYEELTLLVSSLRLDNVVSCITNKSRAQVLDLFKDKYVLINYLIASKRTYLVKENDIISIRKHGKYLFKGIKKETNKKRLIVSIYKYK